MLALTPDLRLALSEDVMLQAIPELEHYFAFDVRSGEQFRLNRTAHWVLEAIGREATFGEFLERFAEEFDLDREQASRDLSEVVSHAIEHHLVKEET
jgi:hypothetical protein